MNKMSGFTLKNNYFLLKLNVQNSRSNEAVDSKIVICPDLHQRKVHLILISVFFYNVPRENIEIFIRTISKMKYKNRLDECRH